MGPVILGNYYFRYNDVLVPDKVVSYDHHIVRAVLHIFLVVDIALGKLPLANNVHNLALNNHLLEHRVVSIEPVVEMHADWDTMMDS